MPARRYESWYAQGGILVRPNQLQIEVTEPSAANTGVQPFFEAGLDDVNVANTILTTDDEIIEGYNFLGRIEIRADNVTIRNCRVRGQNSAPTGDWNLITCTHSNCTNAKIQWCDLWPQYPHWNWDSGVTGHDFTMEFCHVRETTDNVNIFNTNGPRVGGTTGQWLPYFTNVVLKQNFFENVAYWSAATGGVVHPQDTFTHNDTVQHQGGRGTIIQGNTFKTYYKTQYGHWQAVGGGAYLSDNPGSAPYVGVAIGSLGAGAPRFGGPFEAGGTAQTWVATNTIPDIGSGTVATGRYNQGSLSGLQIGQNVGHSYDMQVLGNWFYGGGYSINGGGNSYPGNNEYYGDFHRNKFSRDQGAQSGGGNATQTINFDTAAEPGWNGHFSAPTTGPNANLYFDGQPITVRH